MCCWLIIGQEATRHDVAKKVSEAVIQKSIIFFVSIAMEELARGILSKDINVLFAVKISHFSVELKRFGLLMANRIDP